MPNSSKDNARRKRLATLKIQRLKEQGTGKEQAHRDDKLDQKVGYGMPGNLGSGSQIGSAAEEAGDQEKDQ